MMFCPNCGHKLNDTPPHYDAILRDWQHGTNSGRISGVIYDDKKARFHNGEFIWTSIITSITGPDANGNKIARTLNSVYLLVGPERKV